MNTEDDWYSEGGYVGPPKEEPLEWDANSTEGENVSEQPLPGYEATLFTQVPGVEVIDAQ